MADSVKISQLPAATTPLTGSEDVALVQGGVTKKASVSELAPVYAVSAGTVLGREVGAGSGIPQELPIAVDAGGNVGIGASPVEARLEVSANGFAANITHNVTAKAVIGVQALNSSFAQSALFLNAVRAANSAYSFMSCDSANFSDVEFNLRGDGNAFADGSWAGGGADYAEYFEWADGNPQNEDRRGLSVVLDAGKIRPATPGDAATAILGVVSANPTIVGDAAWNHWAGKYLRDDYGSYVMEDYEVWEWSEANGNKSHSYAFDAVPDSVTVPEDKTAVIQQRRKINPDYNPGQTYVPRENRPEWSTVGLIGKLRVRVGQPVGDRWVKLVSVSADVEEWLVR